MYYPMVLNENVSGGHDFLRLDFSLWRQRHGLLKFDEEKVLILWDKLEITQNTLCTRP